jgi:WhiB family redox-sensing transcriptional regulator
MSDLPELPAREGWEPYGACLGVDPDLFFLDRTEHASEAKRVCRSCPVVGECLEFALRTNQKFGVWGATSPRERRKLRRERGLTPPPARPERCSNGHGLTDETCIRSYHGGWRCLVCDREYQRRARERRRAEAEKFGDGYWERRGLRVVNGGQT